MRMKFWRNGESEFSFTSRSCIRMLTAVVGFQRHIKQQITITQVILWIRLTLLAESQKWSAGGNKATVSACFFRPYWLGESTHSWKQVVFYWSSLDIFMTDALSNALPPQVLLDSEYHISSWQLYDFTIYISWTGRVSVTLAEFSKQLYWYKHDWAVCLLSGRGARVLPLLKVAPPHTIVLL